MYDHIFFRECQFLDPNFIPKERFVFQKRYECKYDKAENSLFNASQNGFGFQSFIRTLKTIVQTSLTTLHFSFKGDNGRQVNCSDKSGMLLLDDRKKVNTYSFPVHITNYINGKCFLFSEKANLIASHTCHVCACVMGNVYCKR